MVVRADPGRAREAERVARALAGDAAAYAELVLAHQPRLRRLLAARLADPHLAEDVAQEVWMLAHRRLATWRGHAGFGSWLRRIALREAARASERRRLERGRVRPIAWEVALELPAAGAGPARRLAAREEADALLAHLPAREREAFALCAAGWSQGEVAARLARPRGSVATWVRRARRRLARAVALS